MTSTDGFASCVMQGAPALIGMQDKLGQVLYIGCDVANVFLASYSGMQPHKFWKCFGRSV